LRACSDLADLAGTTGAALERALESRFAAKSTDAWIAALRAADIDAHRVVLDFNALMRDPVVRAQGLSVTRDHDGVGPVTTTAPGIKMSLTPPVVGAPAPRIGSDAASILAEIGMQKDLDRLVAAGVITVDGIESF